MIHHVLYLVKIFFLDFLKFYGKIKILKFDVYIKRKFRNMNTGEKIKELRELYGMTQEELAEKLGLKKAAVNKYETGRVVNLKRSTIEKLCEIFNITPQELMGMDEDPNITQEEYYTNPEVAELAQQLKDRPELKVLFDASRDISKEDVQFVIDMIERMK